MIIAEGITGQGERPVYPTTEIPELGSFVVDHAIVNGYVDGADRRAPFGMLLNVAFQGIRVPEAVFHNFRATLSGDERYKDFIRGAYGYNPVIEGTTAAQAKLATIMNGQGWYSEKEFKSAMGFMNVCADIVYANIQTQGEITASSQILGSLNESGIRLDRDQRTGLLAYMEREDARLRRLKSGEVVLVERTSLSVEEFEALPHIEDFGSLLGEALPRVVTDSEDSFGFGTVLGTVKGLGRPVVGDQKNKLLEQLRTHPGIEVLENGRFRKKPDTNSSKQTDIPEEAPDLDELLHGAFGHSGGSVQRKRRKRGSSWS